MSRKRLPDVEEKKQDIVAKATDINVPQGISTLKKFDPSAWIPKTNLGRQVKEGKIKDIDEILDRGMKIIEPEIIDALLSNLETDLIAIGQSKGKFGGGQRNIWRQTQKKTKEGNKPKFSSLVVIGNKNGYLGIGLGKAKETVPAREKAIRIAKLNIIKIKRGCGAWECTCGEPHSIPFKVSGKCGSVKMTLSPAPKGTNLCIENECKKLLQLAGIKDIYSQTSGQTRVKINLIKACIAALKGLTRIKVPEAFLKKAGVIEGRL